MWAEVHCNCANRVPLPGSEPSNAPFRGRRLRKPKLQRIAKDWQESKMNMFQCGHRDGMLVQFALNDIFDLGYLLRRLFRDIDNPFPVFSQVGDPECYADELHLVPPLAAVNWLAEIELLRQGISRAADVPQAAIERLIVEIHRRQQVDRIPNWMGLGQIIGWIRPPGRHPRSIAMPRLSREDRQSTIEHITHVLEDSAKLCHASAQTDNPIRLLL